MVIAILIFFVGFFGGKKFELSRHSLNLDEFWTVYGQVQKHYVGKVDPQKAVEGATEGLVNSLDDPFSGYLTKTQRQDLDSELKGEFEGIGAELTSKNNQITVVSALSGSPAEKAGLKSNDVILEVDGQSTEKLSLDQVVRKIRGPKGTQVTLTVYRSAADEPLKLKITRENIHIASVNSKMIGSVGYIEITQFGEDTVDAAKTAVASLKDKQAKALVIDLRNNPGGYLNSVPPVAGLFLPPGTVVIQKDKDGSKKELRSTELPVLPNIPLYVLVNGGSASAAEILAGALQDYGRAKLIGQKTFGKGSVQDIIPLPSGGALRLTIAEWLTPKGRSINKQGIEPDIKIEAEKTADKDPVLDRALELIKAL